MLNGGIVGDERVMKEGFVQNAIQLHLVARVGWRDHQEFLLPERYTGFLVRLEDPLNIPLKFAHGNEALRPSDWACFITSVTTVFSTRSWSTGRCDKFASVKDSLVLKKTVDMI